MDSLVEPPEERIFPAPGNQQPCSRRKPSKGGPLTDLAGESAEKRPLDGPCSGQASAERQTDRHTHVCSAPGTSQRPWTIRQQLYAAVPPPAG